MKELEKEKPGKGSTGFSPDKRVWVALDEKHFRRLDKFSGEAALYRGWLFDLVMALNQIDPDLAKEVNKVVSECGSEGEKWEHFGRMDEEIWQKYHSELYAVISALTVGSAKTALKGMYDRRPSNRGSTYKPLEACFSPLSRWLNQRS